MLTLDRYTNQIIDIGPVEVKVISVEYHGEKIEAKVTLGIDAPEGIQVDRREITIRKARERLQVDSPVVGEPREVLTLSRNGYLRTNRDKKP